MSRGQISSVELRLGMRDRKLRVFSGSCAQVEKGHTYISCWFANKPFESAPLFTCFYDCGMIEGSFASTNISVLE